MDWCRNAGLTDVDVTVDGRRIRVHGGGSGPPVVMVHGNPTHSYLWRQVVGQLLPSFRCLAVDLSGFGGSAEARDLGITEHAKIVTEVVRQLVDTSEHLTWLAHDWGVAIALNAAAALVDQQRQAIAFTEGHLRWIPSWDSADPGFTALFRPLRETEAGERFVVDQNAFVEDVLLGSLPRLTDDERAHYREPFRAPSRRHAILALARQVPVAGHTPSVAGALTSAWGVLGDGTIPKLLLYGDPGAIIDDDYRRWLRGHADNLLEMPIGPAGHFTPEDQPDAIAAALLSWHDQLSRAADQPDGAHLDRTEEFEAERSRLLGLATRVLGDHGEAEDVVQRAWLRLHLADTTIDNLPAWLTTVTTRLCLDRLRARTPVPDDDLDEGVSDLDPADEVALADSVGSALSVVLDRLTPAERIAFVLHDSFGFEFNTIATLLDTSPAAARKLASRARAKVRQPVPQDRLAEWEVVDAFMAAARQGDFDRLIELLAPDVRITADDAAVLVGTPRAIEGRRPVAEFFNGSATSALAVFVDHRPGSAWFHRGTAMVLFDFSVVDGVVERITFRAEPEVLERVVRRDGPTRRT